LSNIREAQVVLMPCVHMLSLIARGIPVSGKTLPAAMLLSASTACFLAVSSVTVR
jgi:hypothetical protein